MLNEFSKKEAPIQGLAGMGGGVPSRLLTLASDTTTYVEDVFSTFTYDGNYPSTQSINNGINVSGKGGLVWIKRRDSSGNNWLVDTERGASKYLETNTTDAEGTDANGVTSFNSDGFSLGTGGSGHTNSGSGTYVSWTFRKCPGFFDIVTWTANGSVQQLSHNLGSVPGMIIVKRTDGTGNWVIWHRSLSNSLNDFLRFDTADKQSAVGVWGNNAPTSDYFEFQANTSGRTFVAYVFAHNDGSFGEDSDEAVIKCDTATTDSSGKFSFNLGFEPQFVLFKNITSTLSNWTLLDTQRGYNRELGERMYINTNGVESQQGLTALDDMGPTANGFGANFGSSYPNHDYVFLAIRRPFKAPESATDVFTPVLATSSGDYTATAGFPVDLSIYGKRSGSDKWFWRSRLTGTAYLNSNASAGEGGGTFGDYWDSMTAFKVPGTTGDYSDYINYNFKRAPGFLDIVAYTGTGSAQNISHNLGVAPELIITKRRDSSSSLGWITSSYHYFDSTRWDRNGRLNQTNSISGGGVYEPASSHSATQYPVNTDSDVNGSGGSYISYLFATLDGISKVGTYSGTGSAQNIDCGFTNGARFVLIKRADAFAHWIVLDTVRGIVAGNDPYIYFSSSAAETTTDDIVDPFSAGFSVTSDTTANASGGTYLFLAIA